MAEATKSLAAEIKVVKAAPLRVLVCGGRDHADRNAVFRALDGLCGDVSDEHPLGTIDLVVIHGACPTGADLWADEWAIINWSRFEEYPADWSKHGRAAGPIRNQRMIDEGRPDIVLAFPGGRGTADMVRRARAVGIKVREISGRAALADQEKGESTPAPSTSTTARGTPE